MSQLWTPADEAEDLTASSISLLNRLQPIVEPFDAGESIRAVMNWADEDRARQFLTAQATADFHIKTSGELEEVDACIHGLTQRANRLAAERKLLENERDLLRPYCQAASGSAPSDQKEPSSPPPPWNGRDRFSAISAGIGAALMPVIGFTAIGIMVHKDPRVDLLQGILLAGIAVVGQLLPKIRHDQLRSEDDRERFRRRLNTVALILTAFWIGMLCLAFGDSLGGDGSEGGNTSTTISRLLAFSTILGEMAIGAVCYIACQLVCARHAHTPSLVRNKDRAVPGVDISECEAVEDRYIVLCGKLQARKASLAGLLELHIAPVLGEYENVRAALRPLSRKPAPNGKGSRLSKFHLNGDRS